VITIPAFFAVTAAIFAASVGLLALMSRLD